MKTLNIWLELQDQLGVMLLFLPQPFSPSMEDGLLTTKTHRAIFFKIENSRILSNPRHAMPSKEKNCVCADLAYLLERQYITSRSIDRQVLAEWRFQRFPLIYGENKSSALSM